MQLRKVAFMINLQQGPFAKDKVKQFFGSHRKRLEE